MIRSSPPGAASRAPLTGTVGFPYDAALHQLDRRRRIGLQGKRSAVAAVCAENPWIVRSGPRVSAPACPQLKQIVFAVQTKLVVGGDRAGHRPVFRVRP